MNSRIKARLAQSPAAGPRFRCGHYRYTQEPDSCRDCYLRMYGRAIMSRKRLTANPRIWFERARRLRATIRQAMSR
jgi:hypothetical protein